MPDDLIAAHRLAFWTELQKGYWRVFAIWFVSVVGFAAVIGRLGNRSILPVLLFGPAVAIAMSFAATFYLCVVGPLSARKTYRIQAALRSPFKVTWNDEFVRFTSKDGEARLQWVDLYDVSNNATCLLLYESDRFFRVIPKRYLSENQAADIVALAEQARKRTTIVM